MILRIALEKYKVIKKIGDKYIKNFNDISAIDDILNNLTQINNLMKKNSIETCIAFKAMLDFMYRYPYLNNAKKIFYAFSVYEKMMIFLNCTIRIIFLKILLKVVLINFRQSKYYKKIY